MSDQSAIEWTDATWNPVVGCDQISPGCAHCYAKAIHDRRHKAFLAGGNVLVPQYAQPFEVVRPRADRLEVPLHWKTPRRVFVNSMSDLFHEDVPDQFLHDVYAVMEQARQHTFQVLTKRAARMRDYLAWRYGPDADTPGGRIPSRHIWHGVSVENQHFADERIPLLLQTPSAMRFISAEPLLGPVDLFEWLLYGNDGARVDYGKLDWLIVGGESGPGARPFDLAWARSLVQQCQVAGVPVFVKQLGANPVLRLSDLVERAPRGKGGDPAAWAADLRVREFPRSA